MFLFRNDYPAIERNSVNTFYEVLVDGQFQLLKCRAKSVYLHKDTEAAEEERVPSKELLYIYTPNKKILLIKKNKSQIISQLPDYAANIENIVRTKRLKLKNEAALKELVVELNRTF